MRSYELVLSEAAAYFVFALPTAERRRIAVELERIKVDPFRVGDLREPDSAGRIHEVVLASDWLITFRADHAVKEIRILRIERVED